jgi:two-component system chemotaxis response regulator CheB
MTVPVRVVIADDSSTQRELIAALLREDPSFAVVGMAADGREAIEAARTLRPDVITMDVQMPRLDGLEATRRIMEVAPSRIIVVCAVGDEHQVDLSFRAVAAGALELVAKPQSHVDVRAWGARLQETVRLMAEIPVVRRHGPKRTTSAAWGEMRGRVDAMGIVASTGGPPALAELLRGLEPGLPAPLFLAQHTAPGFTEGLARWLGGVCSLRVVIAKDGVKSHPGCVYLPPDEHDLVVDAGGIVRVLRSESAHCPSADRLLTSLAEVYGRRSGGLVLTGMGEDGALGIKAIVTAGGIALAQDEASSVVYGMPKVAVRVGAMSVALSQMGPTLHELCTPGTRG